MENLLYIVVVYAVVFEIMCHFRLKKRDKEWEVLVRGLVTAVNRMHDQGKPYTDYFSIVFIGGLKNL